LLTSLHDQQSISASMTERTTTIEKPGAAKMDDNKVANIAKEVLKQCQVVRVKNVSLIRRSLNQDASKVSF